jgi:hypothetical protein
MQQSMALLAVDDIASDRWTLGPPLPQPNNHGVPVSAEPSARVRHAG